jgi:hypothetical protein
MMLPNSAFSNAFSSAAFNTVAPAASVADASSSLSFMAIPCQAVQWIGISEGSATIQHATAGGETLVVVDG